MILLEDVPKLLDDLLQPIPGDNPSGQDLRYDKIYDDIRESRREDEDLNQGAWQTERKVADLPKTISLATNALKQKTKDLQIAAWLTDANLRKDGFAGLALGLKLFYGLLDKFWDTVYPPIEEDDLELRAAPLTMKLDIQVRQSPLNREGHSWFLYVESRAVGYEDQAKDPIQKKKRDKALADKKLAPEIFDKSFRETPKVYYVALEKSLDECITSLKVLTELCDEKPVLR
jgi:type VI secretion system protein ImpA